MLACGIQFKHLPDERPPDRINDKTTGLLVIHIPQGGILRPHAVGKFLSDASADVHRKIVHVIFGLPYPKIFVY